MITVLMPILLLGYFLMVRWSTALRPYWGSKVTALFTVCMCVFATVTEAETESTADGDCPQQSSGRQRCRLCEFTSCICSGDKFGWGAPFCYYCWTTDVVTSDKGYSFFTDRKSLFTVHWLTTGGRRSWVASMSCFLMSSVEFGGGRGSSCKRPEPEHVLFSNSCCVLKNKRVCFCH